MIELRTERASASIDPKTGGRLASLVIDGHNVIGAVPARMVREFIGSEPGTGHDWYRGIFPLVPWAGALRDGEFIFDGVTHHVDLDANGAAQHGILAERRWDVEETVGKGAVTLSAQFGPEFPGRWPFAGHAVQSFRLNECALQMRLEVHSSGQRMPAIAGFHPWFRCRLDDGAEASVTFSPTSRLVDRSGGVLSTNNLGQRPWDEAFVGLAEPPTISWVGGPSLKLASDASVWVYFEELPGAFCIEPWTGPFNGIETKWARVVTPGNPLVLNFEIQFD